MSEGTNAMPAITPEQMQALMQNPQFVAAVMAAMGTMSGQAGGQIAAPNGVQVGAPVASPAVSPVGKDDDDDDLPDLSSCDAMKSEGAIYMSAWQEYKKTHNPLPAPEIVEMELLDKIETELQLEDVVRKGSGRKPLKAPTKLPERLIAEVAAAYGNIAKIKMGEDIYVLGYYGEKGTTYYGTYRMIVADTTVAAYPLNRLIRKLSYNVNKRERNEVYNCLLDIVPERKPTYRPELLCAKNGVYNFETKEFKNYEDYRDCTFLNKIDTNYNPQAKNVTIHNDDDGTDWNIEDWVRDLYDTQEEADMVWTVIHAACRSNVDYGTSVFLTNSNGSGANGKSTLCKLIENIITGAEKESYKVARLSLEELSEKFALSRILNACLIVGDENNTEERLTNMAKFKSLVDGREVSIERKYGQPFSYKFRGLVIQNSNDYPDIKDKTDSFTRRIAVIDHKHCYDKIKRKYIRDDYVDRQEVLEYCLLRVIQMGDVRKIGTCEASEAAMRRFRENTNPVEEFMNEFVAPDENGEIRLAWKTYVPLSFLYDLYKEWYKDAYNRETGVAQKTFNSHAQAWCRRSGTWEITTDKNGKITQCCHNGRMDCPEPLILEYDLDAWKNKGYTGSDPSRICIPQLANKYRAMIRI